MRVLPYILLALVVILPGTIRATADEDNGEFENNKERWESMTDAERETVVRAYRRWKSLPEQDRQTLRAKYDKFKALPAEQKLAVAVNARHWKRFDPDKRRRVRQYFSGVHGDGPHPPLPVFFRITGHLLEQDKPVTKQEVMALFRKRLDECIIERLTPEQKQDYADLENEREKMWFVFGLLREEVVESNPEELSGLTANTGEYLRTLHGLTMRLFHEKMTENLPPSQLEMALFIRANVMRQLRPDILAFVASRSPEERENLVKRIAQCREMDEIIASMPTDMKERYDSFDEGKKLATLRMVFDPLRNLKPMQLRMANHHHPPGPPPPGARGPHHPPFSGP
ncbi:MAG: DUF3106 domain-containing protein [Planctomycetota bacterium]